jgi:hypothetical protein
VKLFFIFLLLFGCQANEHKLKPSDTKPKEKERNWEYLYARELKNALYNQDDAAFYFFWPLYLEARYENKQKQFEN